MPMPARGGAVPHELTIVRFKALSAHHDSLVGQLARVELDIRRYKMAGHASVSEISSLVLRQQELRTQIRDINRELRAIEWEGEGILHRTFVKFAERTLEPDVFAELMAHAQASVDGSRFAREKAPRRSGRARLAGV